MKKKKIFILAVFTAIIVLTAGVIFTLTIFRKTYTDSNIKVEWSQANQPLTVSGEVYNNNRVPIPDLEIQVNSWSAEDTLYTDENGRFSIKLGEPEIIDVKIGKVTIISNSVMGVSILDGLHFKVEVVNPNSPKLIYKKTEKATEPALRE